MVETPGGGPAPVLCESAARDLLASYVALDDPAGWGAHSLAVARTAGTIARALAEAGAGADEDLARAGGLLHDIGRSVTHESGGHCWEGQRILLELGQPVLARFCVTHAFAGLTAEEAATLGWPPADYRPRSWEEKAVTIADGLTHQSRTVVLSDRVASVLERYRHLDPLLYALLREIEPKVRRMMAEVEALIGLPVETLCGAERLEPGG